MSEQVRVIEVDPMARVEGEGSLHVRVSDGEVRDVELRIFEPPRFFEAFLRGRAYTEPPDITARICGICPVAYQMSSCWAIEDACGVAVPGHVREFRRLLYCGEWIESHALHIYLLHAPDFLGYPSAIALAADHPELVERGLRLKAAGNALMSLVGGRAVHPVNVRVGGFYRLPTADEVAAIRPALEQALEDALETLRTVAGLPFPDLEQPYPYLALVTDDGYPLEAGTLATSTGQRWPVAEFLDHVREEHVARSNALHATLDGEAYVVGPLARFSINRDRLSPLAAEAASSAGLGDTCRNPFRSIVVRAVELVYAVEEALRLLDAWAPGLPASVPVAPRAGVGHGASEAPRGLLYHRYRLDDDGTIEDAVIVPPTSQNLAGMEADLTRFLQRHLDLPYDEMQLRCEQAVRNYDPCISCATHALRLTVEDVSPGSARS
ncbi:MAG: Ni/Fe hydrogenase subunit alpha [Candidatus Nanopelagicales bacterium]